MHLVCVLSKLDGHLLADHADVRADSGYERDEQLGLIGKADRVGRVTHGRIQSDRVLQAHIKMLRELSEMPLEIKAVCATRYSTREILKRGQSPARLVLGHPRDECLALGRHATVAGQTINGGLRWRNIAKARLLATPLPDDRVERP